MRASDRACDSEKIFVVVDRGLPNLPDGGVDLFDGARRLIIHALVGRESVKIGLASGGGLRLEGVQIGRVSSIFLGLRRDASNHERQAKGNRKEQRLADFHSSSSLWKKVVQLAGAAAAGQVFPASRPASVVNRTSHNTRFPEKMRIC